MEFNSLKRDQASLEWRRECLLGPSNMQSHLHLARYEVTEEELRTTRSQLAHPYCSVEKITITQVTLNDKKTKLLAKGIAQNSTIKELSFDNCKIRVHNMNKLANAIGANESIEHILFSKCNLLQKHCTALAQIPFQNVSLKHLVLIEAGIGDLAMIELAKGIREAICLETIDLRFNHFEKNGFVALIDAMKETMACKVFKLEGFQIEAEEAKILGDFFCQPNCLIDTLDVHQAEFDLEALEKICTDLKNCDGLHSVSFSKNNLYNASSGYRDDSDSSLESKSSLSNSEMKSVGLSSMNEEGGDSMLQPVVELILNHQQMERLCLQHCFIHDRGMKNLSDSIVGTNLRYVNVGWCRLTSASMFNLCKLIRANANLEKLLLHHNEMGDEASMTQLFKALRDNDKILYLDISANKVTAESLKALLKLQADNYIKLQNLQCRKNDIDGTLLKGVFKSLGLNRNLKILNLSWNRMNNENLEEIRDHYTRQNVFIERIIMRGNKNLHSSIEEHIDDECKKNLLIQQNIIPMLGPDTTSHSRGRKSQTCCKGYDLRNLEFKNLQYLTVDFIEKFCSIHNEYLQSLTLSSVHTEGKLTTLLDYISNSRQPVQLNALHIENCPTRKENTVKLIRSLKTNEHLKRLSLVDMSQMELQKHLHLLYRSLKRNHTLEYLSLGNNEIYDYKYINRLIQKNKTIHTLDIRGNYMSEEILKELYNSLLKNIELEELLYDSQDKILEEKMTDLLKLELEKNLSIHHDIKVLLEKGPNKKKGNLKGAKKDLIMDLSGASFKNPAALIKLLSYSGHIKKLDLQKSDLDSDYLTKLAQGLSERKIHVEELNLSKLAAIDDELILSIGKLLFDQREDGSSSSVTSLIIDDNSIERDGLTQLLEQTIQNTTVRKISARNCEISYDESECFDWRTLIGALSKNCSLDEIDLRGNEIPDILKKEIETELDKNRKIIKYIIPVTNSEELFKLRRQFKDRTQIKPQPLKKSDSRAVGLFNSARNQTKTGHSRYRRGSEVGKSLFKSQIIGKKSGLQTLKEKKSSRRVVAFLDDGSKSDKKGSDAGGSQFDVQSMSNLCTGILKKTTLQEKRKINITLPEETPSQQSELETSSDNSEVLAQKPKDDAPDADQNSLWDGQSELDLDTAGNQELNAQTLSLQNNDLTTLDFLAKFLKFFPKIQRINLRDNARLTNNEMDMFQETINANQFIKYIDVTGTKINGSTKAKMDKELVKNQQIAKMLSVHEDRQTINSAFSRTKTVNLAKQRVKDISFLDKMLQDQEMIGIQRLNLSHNALDDSSCQFIDFLEHFPTITHLDISHNEITQVGLNLICQALSRFETVKSLDISENKIPEKSLKMLMGTLQNNFVLSEIKYSLTEENSKERKAVVDKAYRDFFGDDGANLDQADAFEKFEAFVEDEQHHTELKCWHYIVFPVWIWKTFIHAKHQAFKFRFHPEILQKVEDKNMKHIGIAMYFITFVYLGMMFGFPSLHIKDECGAGIETWVFIVYGIFALFTAMNEVIWVLLVEKTINQEEKSQNIQHNTLLSFNRWHTVELIMGQIARLDTFLDACFLVMLIQCKMWNLVVPVSIFIALMLSYPMWQIFKLCKVNKTLTHTQPYMERNCQLAFIREYMLLATVLDSFCIDNTVTINKKPIVFGKLMGAYTFFFQDFPQLMIHLYFLFFIHTPEANILHKHTIVLVGLVVSSFAIMISLFNFVMFKQNDFDPKYIEMELIQRRISEHIKPQEDVILSPKSQFLGKSHLRSKHTRNMDPSQRRKFANDKREKMRKLLKSGKQAATKDIDRTEEDQNSLSTSRKLITKDEGATGGDQNDDFDNIMMFDENQNASSVSNSVSKKGDDVGIGGGHQLLRPYVAKEGPAEASTPIRPTAKNLITVTKLQSVEKDQWLDMEGDLDTRRNIPVTKATGVRPEAISTMNENLLRKNSSKRRRILQPDEKLNQSFDSHN